MEPADATSRHSQVASREADDVENISVLPRKERDLGVLLLVKDAVFTYH